MAPVEPVEPVGPQDAASLGADAKLGAGMRAPPPAACAPCGLGRGRAFRALGAGTPPRALGTDFA